MEIKKEFEFMLELDKFFEDYERNNKKFKLFVDFNNIDTTYSGNALDMSNVSIKLKEEPKKKINVVRKKNINNNKNSIF